MPLYTYECRHCGTFRAWRNMSRSEMPVRCPTCSRSSRRCVSAPRLGMDPIRRKAHTINERSQHEPKVVSAEAGSHRHPGHRHDHGRKKDLHASRHPWMIRH